MNLVLMIVIGFVVFFAVWLVFSLFEDVAGEEYKLQEKDAEVKSPMLKMIIPLGRMLGNAIKPFFREVEQTIFFQEKRSFTLSEYGFRLTGWWRQKVENLLIGSGMLDLFDPLEIIGFQFIGLVIGSGIGLFLASEIDQPLLVYIFLLIGFFFPLLALNERASKRRFEIQIMLPYSLDLLTLSVEAGIDFTAALQKIVDRGTQNALLEEFSRMIQQIQIGKPRPTALRELSDRIDIEEVKTLSQALIQADELGSPLGPVLRIQAEQLRVKRSQRAEKLAQQAPVKMLFPLVGCIFPTVFIVLFGPMAIQVLQTFMK